MFDEENNRWITNVTSIPSKLFRLKFSINDGSIQRLSRASYQPSLVDVEVTDVRTTEKSTTVIKYRVLNYHSGRESLRLLVKNIGQFMLVRHYKVAGGGSEEDEIEYDPKDRQSGLTSDTISFTITSGSRINGTTMLFLSK